MVGKQIIHNISLKLSAHKNVNYTFSQIVDYNSYGNFWFYPKSSNIHLSVLFYQMMLILSINGHQLIHWPSQHIGLSLVKLDYLKKIITDTAILAFM